MSLRAVAVVSLALVLCGCAVQQLDRRARALAADGNYEQAFATL